jgi:predicted Zn-ribbon and HTH transcriptional regulator
MPNKEATVCYDCKEDVTGWKQDLNDSEDNSRCPRCKASFSVWIRMLWGEDNS